MSDSHPPSDPQPLLSCGLYDYLEIACLFHYELEVSMIDGGLIRGRAITTLLNQQREECLQVACTASNGAIENQEIVANQIASLKVLDENPRFDYIKFSAD